MIKINERYSNTRLQSLILKYLKATDVEDSLDNTRENEKAISKAIDTQFETMEKIEEFSKSFIEMTCQNSKYARVNTFFELYI